MYIYIYIFFFYQVLGPPQTADFSSVDSLIGSGCKWAHRANETVWLVNRAQTILQSADYSRTSLLLTVEAVAQRKYCQEILLLSSYSGGGKSRRDSESIGCTPFSVIDRLVSGKFYTKHSKLLDYPTKFFAFYRKSITSFNELVKLIGRAITKEDTNLIIPNKNNCFANFSQQFFLEIRVGILL